MRMFGIMALALALTGCGLMNREADGTWLLIEATVGDDTFLPVTDAPVTLVVERGAVTGSTGCNEYAAEADVVGGRFTVFEDRAITRNDCDPAVAEVEDVYWAALQQSVVYRVTSDRLQLEGEGTLLEFVPAS
jgi:heat shock protein HslJ